MVGRKFAHYSILEQAGAGGMGVVYRARDDKLQRDVALKLPAAEAAFDGQVRARLLAEARAASALNHPNICTIYEVGEFEGQPYIAMEYLAGESLNRRIPHEGLPTETVLDYGAQIAAALEHAHSQGILHRDLKSANVNMTAAGQIKVLDFGLAVSLKDSEIEGATQSSIMDSNKVSGTLAYIAPEVLGGATPDVQSDIWSLGVLLYEMASGTHPFRGRTIFDMTAAIQRESARPLPTHIAPGLRGIILRCLAKQPDQRYQRASEVHAALEALQSNGGTIFQLPPESIPRQKQKRNYWLLLALLAVAAAAIFYFAQRGAQSPTPIGPGGKLRLLLSTENNLSGPALSQDAKMIAYVVHGDARDDLFVTRVAGGERVKLTRDDSRKADPVFSPDGEKIAFARKAASEVTPEICTIPSFGGEVDPIAQAAAFPAWSPDGSRLVYVRHRPGEPEALAVSSLDASESRVLLAGDAVYPFLGRPSWSPDAKLIAVPRSRGGESREIWIVPLSGQPAYRFSNDPVGVVSDTPVFTPDGRGLIYRSTRGGASNLWLQPLNGSPPTQITSGPGPDTFPSIARDGTLAFLNSRSRFVLSLYRSDSAESSVLLSDSSKLWAPAFSPDGQEIAFSRDEPDGSWYIWITRVDEPSARQLTFGKVPEIYPRFTPDGSHLYFSTWGPEPLRIWQVLRKGGPAKPFAPQATLSDSYADIAPDGRSIVFARTEEKVAHIYIQSADGSGSARRVLDSPATVPRWSPDGHWIAFCPDRGFTAGVFLVHPDGSGLHRVTSTGGWPVWWPMSDKLGFQAIGADGNTEIRVLTLRSLEITTLPKLHFAGTNYPFDISRDAKSLALTNSQHISDEIWLLEPVPQK
jgi:eukaryotic-like serine/threonine-protein kinase